MATHPHDHGSAMPLSAALAIIPSLPRPLLSRLVARAIERLDEMEPDPDREPNGDDLDGCPSAEDEFGAFSVSGGLSYAPYSEDDEEDDPSGGSADDEGEPDDAGEDRGTYKGMTLNERASIDQLRRHLRRRARG